MVKLTPELIQQSYQYINPVRDRELDLRGYKIPVIENLGATLDQFDTIDFSDNDIRKLDGFPLLNRLKWLTMNNNRIVRIADNLTDIIPHLETLLLTNNLITELADIDPLANLKELKYLSLLHNPVSTRPYYRQYVIYRIPQLRILDFRKIKLKERNASNELFKSKQGKQLLKQIAAKRSKAVIPGSELEAFKKPGLGAEEVHAIKQAIANATSLEEIERLNQMLQSGQIPARFLQNGILQ